MPSWFPFPEAIKKKACGYLIQRYLGQYLEQKLSLDQLEISILEGTGSITDILLNVEGLNDSASGLALPFEFLDGYLREISVSIPWSALLSESSNVQITGLRLCVQPKQRQEDYQVMLDSMRSSMSTSIQIAKECLQDEDREDEYFTSDPSSTQRGVGPVEGLEMLARLIDSALSKVKVRLVDTVFRIEHVPKGCVGGVGLEIHVKKIDYFDEAGASSPTGGNSDLGTPVADSKEGNVYHVAAFSTKKFCLEGITIYTDEFPAEARTFIRDPHDLAGSATEDDLQFHSLGDNRQCTGSEESRSLPESDHVNRGSEPILVAKILGQQELRVTVKKADEVPGLKMDLELNCGSLISVISPRQLETLIALFEGLTSPDTGDRSNTGGTGGRFRGGKPMDDADYRRVEEQLQAGILSDGTSVGSGIKFDCGINVPSHSGEGHRGPRGDLSVSHGWSSAADEDEFLPVGSHSRSHGRKKGQPNPPQSAISGSSRKPESCVSVSSMYTGPGSETSTAARTVLSVGSKAQMDDVPSEVMRFKARVSSFAAILLHSDILVGSSEIPPNVLARGRPKNPPQGTGTWFLTRASIQEMRRTVDQILSALGHFALQAHGRKDFIEARDRLSNACNLSHLRILSAPLVIDGDDRSSGSMSWFSCNVTGGIVEVTECLARVSQPVPTSSVSDDVGGGDGQGTKIPSKSKGKKSTKKRVQIDLSPCAPAGKTKTNFVFTELLNFARIREENARKSENTNTWAEADMRLRIVHVSRNESTQLANSGSPNRTDLLFKMAPFYSEFDLSMLDRLHAYCYPQMTNLLRPLPGEGSGKQNIPMGCVGGDAGMTKTGSETHISIESPHASVDIRFPVPDLRPDSEKRPWWEKSVREDYIRVELEDFGFSTSCLGEGRESGSSFEISSRELHGLFFEDSKSLGLSFLCAGTEEAVSTTAGPSNASPTNDGGQSRPRLVIRTKPEHSSARDTYRKEDSFHPDFNTISTYLMAPLLEANTSPKSTIFATRKVLYGSHAKDGPQDALDDGTEEEDVVVPAEKPVLVGFMEETMEEAPFSIEIYLPAGSAHIPSKSFYELLYNRINGDLLMWEPSAPIPESYHDFTQSSPDATHFGVCKSGIKCEDFDDDSDVDEASQIYYSVTADQAASFWGAGAKSTYQSRSAETETKTKSHIKSAVTVTVGRAFISLFTPVKNTDGSVKSDHHGEVLLAGSGVKFFAATKKDPAFTKPINYLITFVNNVDGRHAGSVRDMLDDGSPLRLGELRTAAFGAALPTIYLSDEEAGVKSGAFNYKAPVGVGDDSQDMLTAVVHSSTDEDQNVKTFQVALQFRNSTLRHRVSPENETWFTQIIDLFDVVDYPVKGYEPPDTVTELNLTLQACGIDYRPLHLPLRAYITLETFCLSSNISPQSRTSVLRFIIEDGALFLAYLHEPVKAPSAVALASDYACVVDVGLVDLCLRMSGDGESEADDGQTKVDFSASNNVVHVRTCADSGRALTDLLVYYASDGDTQDASPGSPSRASRVDSPAVVDAQVESIVPPGRRGCVPRVTDMEDPELNAMVFDAMQDCMDDEPEPVKQPVVFSPARSISVGPPDTSVPLYPTLKTQLSTGCAETNNNKIDKLPPTAIIEPTKQPEMQEKTSSKKSRNKKKKKFTKILLTTQTSTGSSGDGSGNEAGSSLEGSGEHNPGQSPETVSDAPAFELSVASTTSPTECDDSGVSELERQLAEAVMDEDAIEKSSDEEPFFLLEEAPGSGILPKCGVTEVRVLVPEENIKIIEDHFAAPYGKADVLRAPKHFPTPTCRYTLKEMTLVWHIYGGSDFQTAQSAKKRTGVHKKASFRHGDASVDERGSYGVGVGSCPARFGVSSWASRPMSPATSSDSGSGGSGAAGSSCYSRSCSPQFLARFPNTAVGIPVPLHPTAPQAIPQPRYYSGSVAYSARTSPSQLHFRNITDMESAFVPIVEEREKDRRRQSWQTSMAEKRESLIKRGGPNRQHDKAVELQLSKVRFQHEVYPKGHEQLSRQVLMIHEVEIRDRLALSEINKLMYLYTSPDHPRQSHAYMVVVKALHCRSDPNVPNEADCSLKISVSPLRFNIDQDTLSFLYEFFTAVAASPPYSCAVFERKSSVPMQPPVCNVNTGRDSRRVSIGSESSATSLSEGEFGGSQSSVASDDTLPVYFKSVVFSPAVPVRLDYLGKRVELNRAPLKSLVMGLTQLNNSQLCLKKLNFRHGILGIDKVVQAMLTEWMTDIRRNQLPTILGGLGPLHAVGQLFSGVRDLFWLPVEQYQRDGRIVKGLQRGASAFSTSTAAAALELTQRLVGTLQCAAEVAFDMVSPGPSVRTRKYSHHLARPPGDRRRKGSQPADIREGVTNAYHVLKEGLGETAHGLVAAAVGEGEAKGAAGAVGGVLRQLPPTVLHPVVLAAQATNSLLGGVKNQLLPDLRRDEEHKYKTREEIQASKAKGGQNDPSFTDLRRLGAHGIYRTYQTRHDYPDS